MSQTDFELESDSFARLVLTLEGQVFEDVTVVRAFPLSAPEQFISVTDARGHELLFIESLSRLDAKKVALIEQTLRQREFLPIIERLVAVSSFSTPCTWDVQTDRGQTSFILKGEENIRRLSPTLMLVSDSHGVQYLIANVARMDRYSRKLLDRFL